MLARIFLAIVFAVPSAVGAMWAYYEVEGLYRDAQSLRSGAYDVAASQAETPAVPRTTTRAAEPQVSFAPTPGFVETIAPLGPDSYDEAPASGAQILLIDQQTDARGDTMLMYSRLVARAANSYALADISQIRIPLDPALQSLEIHAIHVIRGEEELDVTQDISVDFLRQENALEQGYFLGQVVALLRIPGLRSRDIVDVSYSVRHDNPVIGNRHSESRYFTSAVEIPHYHFRSLWPRRGFEAVVLPEDFGIERRDEGRTTEFRYGPAALPQQSPPQLVPPWRVSVPFFVATRFSDWNDVARWAAPYYEPEITDAIQAIADDIRAEHPTRPEQIAAALRHVQREINYFAILLGEGGYVPLGPDETLRYAEGDCKAVTLLLLSILAALDIEADAALVSTESGRGIDVLPPSPLSFDHVIVRVRFNGQSYWLDATRPEQAGRLTTLTQPDFGFALIVDEETDGLVEMGEADIDQPLIELTERFRILSAGRNAEAEAEMVLELRGEMADNSRYVLEEGGEAAVRDSFVNTYINRFEGEFDIAALEIMDDRERNILTYRWQGNVQLIDYGDDDQAIPTYAFGVHGAAPIVVLAPIGDRELPLLMPYPYFARQTTMVEWPEDAGFLRPADAQYDIWSPTFRISSDIRPDFNTATLTAETRVLAPELMPDEFERADTAMQSEELNYRVMVLGGEISQSDRDRLMAGSFLSTR
ncbi:DUF3857 domain-containing protein [Hyphobacterium sp.]|uniref:DUF3857 domain-containing protein n=1 Tax=Hyphobacterium sp. TaxID=2004662 RepID=UPI003749A254